MVRYHNYRAFTTQKFSSGTMQTHSLSWFNLLSHQHFEWQLSCQSCSNRTDPTVNVTISISTTFQQDFLTNITLNDNILRPNPPL